jgi:chemotaxis protein methyltransferase CheR
MGRMTIAAAFIPSLPGISPGIYTPADFKAVVEIVYAKAGIVLPAGKAMLVYSRLAPLVRESGCGTFANYIEKIRSNPIELDRALAALTTNHTFFYREAHHFKHFEMEVRPSLLRVLSAGQPVRMWSAGCSSGEETWSLVMTLLGGDRSEGLRIAARDVRVLANDIAPQALEKGVLATYPAEDLKPIPGGLRRLWTKRTGEVATITPEARSIVRFRHLNLQGEWPISCKFDVIFCRNVMIYFDRETRERLVARFADYLVPGGHLYIGHSERVSGPAAVELESVNPTIYRRRG